MSLWHLPRRRLRLSLRAFLVLVLVLGGWLGWQAHKAREQRLAVEAIRQYGGFVHYDWEFVGGALSTGRQPRAPAWLRRGSSSALSTTPFRAGI